MGRNWDENKKEYHKDYMRLKYYLKVGKIDQEEFNLLNSKLKSKFNIRPQVVNGLEELKKKLS